MVATFIVAIRIYSDHFSWYKIQLFYHIQVGYSGQSDIMASKGWPKVANIGPIRSALYHSFLCNSNIHEQDSDMLLMFLFTSLHHHH